jgi:two-component system LytT family response regulator
MKFRVLIVDDEPLARSGMRARLRAFPEVTVLDDCEDGESAVEAIRTHSPELVFLDVQMPGLSGFDVLKQLPKERTPFIIFLTAYDQYALEAFKVHALDYLLKPIEGSRFVEAMKRAQQQIKLHSAGEIEDRLRGLLERQVYLQRLAIRTGSRMAFVLVDEIDWIEATGDYLKLHLGQRAPLVHETLNSLESRLDPSKFVRIHRSTIIQASRIRDLQSLPNRELSVRMLDGTRLRVSRTYRDRFDRWLLNESKPRSGLK